MPPDVVMMDNLIVLGEAVPDELKDNRKVVCTACYSPEYGLVRIYPVPPETRMRRWDKVSMPLVRNTQDTRVESWKVQGSKHEWDVLGKKIHNDGKLPRQEQIGLLHKLYKNFGVDCIQDLNDAEQSLGIIKPRILKAWLADRVEKYDPTVQVTLDSDLPFLTIHNYPKQPRVRYRCSKCRIQNPHDQQILEWGVYEWMRKNPDAPDKGLANLRLFDEKYERYFLVGNIARHRNAFMVISVFRFKRSMQPFWI